MILSNLAIKIEHLLDTSLVNQLSDERIHEVMDVFYHHDSGMILENVGFDGGFSDTIEGRLLSPSMYHLNLLSPRKYELRLRVALYEYQKPMPSTRVMYIRIMAISAGASDMLLVLVFNKMAIQIHFNGKRINYSICQESNLPTTEF